MISGNDSYAALIVIVAFVVIIQLLLCFKVKRTLIKLLPVLVFIASTAILFICAMLARDWDALGYMLLALLSFVLTIACGVCWLIWTIVKIVKR